MLRGLRAVELLRFLLVASLVGPAVIFVLLGWFTYEAAFLDAEHEIVRTSEVAREHAAKVFDSFRLVTDRVEDLLAPLDDEAIRRAEGMLHDRFKEVIRDLPQIQSFVVLDAASHLLVATAAMPVSRTDDFSDRDYVQALRGGETHPYISRVQTSRVSGNSFFGWGRARRAPDGRFGGVIDIAVSPEFFMRFYATLVSEAGASLDGRVVTIIREDGQILVRFPGLGRRSVMVPPTNPFFDALRRDAEAGVYRNHSVIDDGAPERLFAYRRVPGQPIYIVAGLSLDTIRAEWRRGMVRYLATGLPGMLALFLLTLATLHGARREQQALAQVRSEMKRRELAEEQLRQSQKMEAVGQLTGGIAHDFNNLLTVIRAAVDQLRRDDLPAERRARYVEAISDTTTRAAKLTGQLLAFARRQTLKPEVFDVAGNLAALVEMVRTLTGSRITIETAILQRPLFVKADPSQFDTSIVNMAVNARDAMNGEGRVTIGAFAVGGIAASPGRAAVAGDHVAVTISDDGVGIGPDQIGLIFEPFFTTKEVGQGTGLGLSQVFGFAKQSGGEIVVESEPGRGTTFTLYLPRVAAEASPGAEAPSPVAPAAGRGARVLVVEDDDDVGVFATQTLASLGCDVVWATSAEAALAELARHPERFDVVFTDVVMPGMSGIELAEEIRRRHADLPVVLTSGHSHVLAQTGTIGFELLQKPYSMEQLSGALLQAAKWRRVKPAGPA